MPSTQAGNFNKLAEGIYLEGLAVDYARNVVWYSDVIAGGIHGVTLSGAKVTSFNTERMWRGHEEGGPAASCGIIRIVQSPVGLSTRSTALRSMASTR